MTIQNLIDELQEIISENPGAKNSEVIIHNWEFGLYYLQRFELKLLDKDEIEELQKLIIMKNIWSYHERTNSKNN